MPETTIDTSRLGIHYFADNDHYQPADLQRWLPRLRQLGLEWITLRGPDHVAIPQDLIEGLVKAGIQPIVHLPLSLESPPAAGELAAILRAYATWGVSHVVFFDRPNQRSAWPSVGWTQRGLVERFLEVFLPLASAAIEAGLAPVFPPLEPGGDYWDTAFLRAALEELAARGENQILEKLAIGAYAWTNGRPLDWGAGGPESWPATLPYITPEGSQDQRGFRIFDWYNTISRAALGRELEILILAAGEHATGQASDAHVNLVDDIAQTMSLPAGERYHVPANVLACNFWLLSANERQAQACGAWFNEDGSATSIAQAWLGSSQPLPQFAQQSNQAIARGIRQATASMKSNTPFKGTFDYLSKDGKMFDETLMQQLKELAAAGVEVHINLNAGGFSNGNDDGSAGSGDQNQDTGTGTDTGNDTGSGNADRYANYRKVVVPQEKNFSTAIFAQDEQGLASDDIASRLYHNDVVEILDESGPRWRLVRIADLGDFGERGEAIPGAIGWLRLVEGVELVPLA